MCAVPTRASALLHIAASRCTAVSPPESCGSQGPQGKLLLGIPLVQIMAWCRKATSHYLKQCCGNSTSADGICPLYVNTLRPRHNGRHFEDSIFKCIFLNEIILILIKISLKFILKSPINTIAALVQIMAWHWPGNKPWSESVMIILLTLMHHSASVS